jgi:SAM-dependent methyltransferase
MSLPITYPINVAETPRSRTLAHAIHWVPLVGGLFSRLPEKLRRRLSIQHASINERIVEHPWAFMNLGLTAGRVLDVGCCFSGLSLELAGLGFETWGVDTLPYPFTHPNFRFVQDDICRSSLPDARFDRVMAISTIEHIGLGHYGDPIAGATDQVAMREIHRMLKVQGKMILSVPFGKKRVTRCLRVYDAESFHRLVGMFQVEKMEFFVADQGSWRMAPENEAETRELDGNGRPQAIVMVKAGKTFC